MSRNKLYIVIICLFAVSSCWGQQLFFHPQTSYGGLNYSSVSSIAEDTTGRIWLAVGDDVLRYDGYTYYSYSDKLVNVVQFFASYNALRCTQSGALYLATSKGILRYDASTDAFRKVNDCSSRRIYEDAKGNLWIGNSEVIRYEPCTGECTHMKYEGKDIVGQVYTRPDLDVVYVISDWEILQYNVFSSTWSSIALSIPYDDARIMEMTQVDSVLYILTERHGLYALTSPVSIRQVTTFPNSIARHLSADRMGRLWIGTMQGLYCYHPLTGEKTCYTKTAYAGGLPDNSIQSIFFDHADNLWIGSFAGTLCVASEQYQHHFYSIRLSEYGVKPAPISCIAEYEGQLYIGTEGDGLYAYDSGKGITHHYTAATLRSNNIKTLVAGDGKLYIGTYLGGLYCLQHGAIHRIALPSNQIYDATCDSKGIWLSYQSLQEQVTHIDYASGCVDNYILPRIDGVNLSSRLYHVCLIDSLLWISTRSSLHCFSATQRQYLFTITPPDPAVIMTMAYDSAHQCLWIGTSNRGIMRFDPRTRSFAVVPHTKERIHGYISTLTTTDNMLWIGTNRGLYALDPGTYALRHYTEQDGIEPVIFCSYRTERHPQRLYVGGVGTISYMEEKDLTANPIAPRTIISDIHINGHSVFFPTEKEQMDSAYATYVSDVYNGRLNLRHNENNLTITLSNTNYLLPQKNTYRFRLTKCNRRGHPTSEKAMWTEVTSAHRAVMFTQIPTGHYLFEAQSCNNDGVWGDSILLQIRIPPVFWKSAWAYTLYVFVLLLIGGYIVFNQRHQRKLKEQLYRTEVRAEEQRRATESKVRFFSQYCIERGNDIQREQMQSRLDQLTHMISQHMADGHIDIDSIAREMGMSRRSLYNFVKENTGQSIVQYIRSYRIAEAARLMMAERLNIKQAMARVGIDSQSYFIKAFKQEFGRTPTEYIADIGTPTNK